MNDELKNYMVNLAKQLCKNNDEMLFVTVFMGMLEKSLEILLKNMREAIKIHAGDVEQSGDITMFALKWNEGKDT